MKGLIVIIILLISSFSYFGVVNDSSITNEVNVYHKNTLYKLMKLNQPTTKLLLDIKSISLWL